MAISFSIRRIVRLRQKLKRWRARAAWGSSMATAYRSPPDVPKGHLAVSVGSTNRRFVVKADHLNHPAFRKLLKEAEEEYGFSRSGPLSLPCEETLFLQILYQISSSYASLFPDSGDLDRCGCYHHQASNQRSRKADVLPLLPFS